MYNIYKIGQVGSTKLVIYMHLYEAFWKIFIYDFSKVYRIFQINIINSVIKQISIQFEEYYCKK